MCMAESPANDAWQAIRSPWACSGEDTQMSLHIYYCPSSILFPPRPLIHAQVDARSKRQSFRYFPRLVFGAKKCQPSHSFFLHFTPPYSTQLTVPTKSQQEGILSTQKRNEMEATAVPRRQLLFSSQAIAACPINFEELDTDEGKSGRLLMLSRTCPPMTPLGTYLLDYLGEVHQPGQPHF